MSYGSYPRSATTETNPARCNGCGKDATAIQLRGDITRYLVDWIAINQHYRTHSCPAPVGARR